MLNSYHQQDDKFDIVDSNGHCSKFISQCFNPTHARNGCILPTDIVAAMEEKFPRALITNLEVLQNCSYIAKQWTTNAVQHFTSNFFRYQERTIIALLQSLNFKNPKEDCPQAMYGCMLPLIISRTSKLTTIIMTSITLRIIMILNHSSPDILLKTSADQRCQNYRRLGQRQQ